MVIPSTCRDRAASWSRDEALVSGARYAWHGLSRAPTAGELGTWLDAVDRLLAHDPMRG